jgi:hypothetical protein
MKVANFNNLLTESEGSTGKYPTEDLVGYFPVLPAERLYVCKKQWGEKVTRGQSTKYKTFGKKNWKKRSLG